MSELVELSDDGQTATIRLRRPEKRNALTEEMLLAIADHMERCDARSELRAVILTGDGEAFCAGADLAAALQVATGAETLRWNRAWQRATRAIERSRQPVIAAIGGPCLTGGLELALACDLRVAGEDAVFGVTSVAIGSVAGGGATQRLPRLIGMGRAKDLLLSARRIDAREALEIGLVNRVTGAGSHESAARAWAHELAAAAPLSLWWTKWAMNSGIEMPLEAALDWEAALSAHAFVTEDRNEGMSAFLQKRNAHFRGR